MINMREECLQFKGRSRDLCEGRGLDGRLTPPQIAVDQFRESRGLEPIVVTETNFARTIPYRQQTRLKVSLIGDRLAKIFAEEWGALPCGKCKNAIVNLNSMTVEQVQANRAKIVSDIASRATQSVPQWWAKVLTSASAFLHLGGTEYLIGKYLDRACRVEEPADGSITP